MRTRERERVNKSIARHLPVNLAFVRLRLGTVDSAINLLGITETHWENLETKGDHHHFTHAAELLYIARGLGVSMDDLVSDPAAFRQMFDNIPCDPLGACVPSKSDRKPWRDGWYCLLGRGHKAPHALRPNQLHTSEYA